MPEIDLPDGFKINVFTDEVPNARSMTLGDEMIFVSTRSEGKIYAITNYQDNPKQWSCDGKIHINCYEGRIDIRVYQRDSNFTHEMKIFPETHPNGISLCKMILSEQVEM